VSLSFPFFYLAFFQIPLTEFKAVVSPPVTELSQTSITEKPAAIGNVNLLDWGEELAQKEPKPSASFLISLQDFDMNSMNPHLFQQKWISLTEVAVTRLPVTNSRTSLAMMEEKLRHNKVCRALCFFFFLSAIFLGFCYCIRRDDITQLWSRDWL
jgi:hypothetical protein